MPKVQRIKKAKRELSPTSYLSPPVHPLSVVLPIEEDDGGSSFTSVSQIGSRIRNPGSILFDAIRLDPGEQATDSEAARRFIAIHGKENVVYCNGNLWIFCKETCMWTKDFDSIELIIGSLQKKLTLIETCNKSGKIVDKKIKSYSEETKLTKAMISKLPVECRLDNDWENRMFDSDVAKLLFKNGYYDFRKKEFVSEPDSKILFTCTAPRDFNPIRDEQIISEIRRICFDPLGEDTSSTLLHELMRGVIGDTSRRTFVPGIGPTASGKTLIMVLCVSALGGCVGTFSGDALLYRRDGGEIARENSWLVNIAHRRLAFSSEIKVPLDEASANKCAINGNLLKTAISGGDRITARCAYGREAEYTNKAKIFILANDMPRIHPVDDAIRDRAIPVEWTKSYVENPKLPHEEKRDPSLIIKFKTSKYGDAFIHIMIDEYEKWRKNGFAEPPIKECTIRGKEELLPKLDIRSLLEEDYEITGDKNDWVVTSKLISYLQKRKYDGSQNKIGRDLSQLGLDIGERPFKEEGDVKRRNHKVRLGIKLKQIDSNPNVDSSTRAAYLARCEEEGDDSVDK